MIPVNRHIIEFWDRKNAFSDLDEPEKSCFKISASYDSTTPSYTRSKTVKINRATFLQERMLFKSNACLNQTMRTLKQLKTYQMISLRK